jgi:hypothetical protein
VRNSRKLKEKLFTKNHVLFFVLCGTFGLFFHGEDINMVKGQTVGFIVNLKSLTIHHKLIRVLHKLALNFYSKHPTKF